MNEAYLEITFRKGRPIAAYYYFSGRRDHKSFRTVPEGKGMLVDYSRGGKPIGLEITAPAKVSLGSVNRVLRKLGIQSVSKEQLSPLLAA